MIKTNQFPSCYVLTHINFSVFRAFITGLSVGSARTKQNLVCFAKKSVNMKPFLVRTIFVTHQNFSQMSPNFKDAVEKI